MRKGLLSYLVLLLFLITGKNLTAQAEFNVKLKQNSPELYQFLRQNQGEIHPDSLKSVRNSFPGLESLRSVHFLHQNLRENPVESVDRLVNLSFSGQSPSAVKNLLEQSGQFEFVEENRSVKLHSIESDPTLPNDPEIGQQWYHSYIRTFEAWEITKGDATVVIGVIDTGIEYSHPEFAGQLKVNAAEDLNGNGTFEPWPSSETRNGLTGDFDGVDADGNGFADDVIGWDFTDQPRSPFGGDYLFEDADPQDENQHGTLVSGIIGAKENNNEGAVGIAPGCKILTLRAFSANGTGEDDDISRAIVYAADNGVNVLNFSFGDIYPSLTMHEAIIYAEAKGVIMIGSAGNGTGDQLHYPSNFNEVISVSATAVSNSGEILWPLSSYGLTVSLAAPGSGIFTTDLLENDGGYGTFSGTSTSAPMVSAAAALILSQRGTCTPQQMRGILTTSADDVSQTGWDHLTGAGRLNIEKALQTVGGSHVQITSPLNDLGSNASSVAIIGTALHPEFVSYTLDYQPGTDGLPTWITISTNNLTQVHEDTLGTWDLSALDEGEYTLRLKVVRSNGYMVEDRVRFVRDTTPPEVEVKFAASAWDNNEKRVLIVFRSSDNGVNRLKFRSLGSSNWQQTTFDRTTRNGEFLLGKELLSAGSYEYFVECTNPAGLVGNSPLDTFSFTPAFISLSSFNELNYYIPMGSYLPTAWDLDGDGLKEVVMSEYGSSLGFGRLKFYEYNGGFFSAVDSISQKNILIPKDIADVDGNGLQELLCSVNDSILILEQATANAFPHTQKYVNEGNGYFAARFGDTDGDGNLEMLAKDFEDYYVFERNGTDWSQTAVLADDSPDYFGSVAPLALVDDFDGDTKKEVVYGDYDGDFLIYEHVSGNNYLRTFLDTTNLEKSGSYLTSGDFDQDGKPEIFVAVHSSFLRNADFEYDTPFWWLRIFKSTGDNAFTKVWEDRLYDNDTEDYNAVTSGNLDQDPGDEILFTTFPRTYLIDHDGSDYYFRWFHYGALCTDHVIGDFNGNGVNEFALGLGDSAVFYEFDFNYTGPQPAAWLWGEVSGAATSELHWEASPNATEYLIFRGIYIPGSTSITLIDSTTSLNFSDAGLTSGTTYLYVILAKNPSLNPVYAEEFSNAILLTPHAPYRLDSVTAISATQAMAWFDQPMDDLPENNGKFLLNGQHHPVSMVRFGEAGKRLLLGFDQPLQAGSNLLEVDSTLRDALLGPPDLSTLTQVFTWNPDTAQHLYLTHWEAISDKEAKLWFNFPVDNSALDPDNYALDPYGTLASISWANAQQEGVKVTLQEVAFGALGYPLSITVTGVSAQNGAQILEKEGNTATFAVNQSDLTQTFVYPNPYSNHAHFEGIRFANLTSTAEIEVFSASGFKVMSLTETDGDGGVTWDLRDLRGEKIKPGVYVFRVNDPETGEEFVGKFSVVE
ncbi:MAG: S8 family serine peptidase [Bacteroidia bacterium]|nr:S8 family serine peptidase [Bacteroidia bacterium]